MGKRISLLTTCSKLRMSRRVRSGRQGRLTTILREHPPLLVNIPSPPLKLLCQIRQTAIKTLNPRVSHGDRAALNVFLFDRAAPYATHPHSDSSSMMTAYSCCGVIIISFYLGRTHMAPTRCKRAQHRILQDSRGTVSKWGQPYLPVTQACTGLPVTQQPRKTHDAALAITDYDDYNTATSPISVTNVDRAFLSVRIYRLC